MHIETLKVFCDLVDRVRSPHFGVNYDPSNTILAGEDPLELLRRVKSRVVTMHASDRYLAEGTIEDLRKEDVRVDTTGSPLAHASSTVFGVPVPAWPSSVTSRTMWSVRRNTAGPRAVAYVRMPSKTPNP